jgi:hypothetical protein
MPMDVSRYQAALAPLATALAVLALVGCGGSEREGLIAKGATPAYADGHVDGCASGNAAGGGFFDSAKKDAARFGTDTQYAQGWRDGFETCKARMEGMVLEARLRKSKRDD